MHNQIRGALVARLNTMPSLPPVAYANAPYTPTGATYIRCDLSFSNAVELTLSGTTKQINGFMQLTINTPAGKGGGASNALIDAVSAHFQRPLALKSGNSRVEIVKVQKEPFIATEGAYFVEIVSVYFQSFTV